VISAGVFASRIHAWGLRAATSLSDDHRSRGMPGGLDAAPGRRPERGLEHRVHLHGHPDRAGLLGIADHVQFATDLLGSCASSIAGFVDRPVELDALAARPHPGAERLASREDRDVDVAALDVERRPVDEALGGVAPIGRVLQARLDAQAVGDHPGQVPVAPRVLADDAQHVGRRWSGQPGVGGGVRTASSMRAAGSRASSSDAARWTYWPTPTITGVRGSIDPEEGGVLTATHDRQPVSRGFVSRAGSAESHHKRTALPRRPTLGGR
jgi:hypothetical protein